MRTVGGEPSPNDPSGSTSWDTSGSIDQMNLIVMPDMSQEQIVECWRKNWSNGYLTSKQFRDYWKYKVPSVYSPKMNCNCLQINYDEEEVRRYLLEPLELFICGGDPAVVFKELSDLDNPPALCGKVFKMGEPTYSCRDCGTDPTCVLCIDCFKRSAHRQHRYKLSMSVGGGYCDCGDPEAWKTEAFCENHALGLSAAEGGREELMKRMPKDVMSRTRIVFSTVLKYCYQILTSELTMSVPQDLQVRELEHERNNLSVGEEDVFCTVLFNDETHTFEQVIETLKRAIDCSKKEAIEYATAIDREGRCIVKCSNFTNCNQVRLVIDRQTTRQVPLNPKPLKVVVMPASVLAHQIFAMKLLSWLQQLLTYCEAFRILFSDIAMEGAGKEMSVVEGILNFDTQLWKAARSLWHHLFISGLLMDFENKKRFAKIFTKFYNVMMKDFINDDHDHSYSVSSLSVQLFTVPTISHHLISVDDVLAILLRFFTSECERRRNDEGKLSFERNLTGNALRRAMYVLYDLKYLLSSKPSTWSDPLRRGFLHGFDLLVNLLGWMQGMDATKRQIGQHMEYEPEWESAFNLHFKLAPVLSLILDWCETDKKVLIKAYRNILKKIGECLEPEMKNRDKLCEVADHSVFCIDYDVSTRPISIHLPLSRIFAGLNLVLGQFGMDFYGFENISSKPDPVQIIEPVLRTQVMMAQAQAGMWRRNGYSLINQIYFYKNVKCRTEMFDRDITLLQVGAALIEPNDFLIHLLNKFDLVDWAQKDYEKTLLPKVTDEDETRHVMILVEEFLHLVIQLVGERHVPGIGQVTEDDRIAKEIIHQLCIEPMPHSALNKALPEDTSHETRIERVIDNIARFKKPSQSSGKGVYELKKEFYDQFDVFFYHLSREEMSKAEESQIKRRKAESLEACCPPPKLPAFTPQFRQISNILQSDVMLTVFQTVLDRTSDLHSKTFSETQFHMVLHLVGYALHEEQAFLSTENPIGFNFTDRAEKFRILPQLEGLRGNARIDTHKVLLDWTIRKYKEVLLLPCTERLQGILFLLTIDTLPRNPRLDSFIFALAIETIQDDRVMVSKGAVGDSSQPMTVDTEAETKQEDEERQRRAKLAAARKAAIMAQMATAQKNFILEHKDEFESSSEDKLLPEGTANSPSLSRFKKEIDETFLSQIKGAVGDSSQPMTVDTEAETKQEDEERQRRAKLAAARKAAIMAQMATAQKNFILEHKDEFESSSGLRSAYGSVESMDVVEESPVAFGPYQTARMDRDKKLVCILCQEDQPVDDSGRGFVYAAFVQRSTVMCQNTSLLTDVMDSMPKQLEESPYSINPKVLIAPFVSSCGHSMHGSCWQSYVDGLIQRERRRNYRTARQTASYDVEKTEFLCPLCQCLSNAVIPVLNTAVPSSKRPSRKDSDLYLSFDEFYKCATMAADSLTWKEPQKPSDEDSVIDIKRFDSDTICRFEKGLVLIGRADILEAVESQSEAIQTVERGALDMLQLFFQSILRIGYDETINNEHPRLAMAICQAAAYSFLCTQNFLDSESKGLFELSSRQLDTLSSFSRTLMYISQLSSGGDHRTALENSFYGALDSLLQLPKSQMHIVDQLDPFSLLVSLLVGSATIVKGGRNSQRLFSLMDAYLVKMVFSLQLVQSLLVVRLPTADESMDEEEIDDVTTGQSVLVQLYERARGEKCTCSGRILLKKIEECSKPFLRSVALFAQFFTEVATPPELKEYDCDSTQALLKFIGLGPIEELISQDWFVQYFERCINKRSLATPCPLKYPIRGRTLIELPPDYSELINEVAQFTCPNSEGDESRTPARCLLCGVMLCSQSYCCQVELEGTLVGACTHHAHFCGAGVGICLRVRECKILLLAGQSKGCFMPPPYLDKYGETDQGLRRGDPLHLCEASYRKWQRLWLSHSVQEHISHAMETSQSFLQQEWHHV